VKRVWWILAGLGSSCLAIGIPLLVADLRFFADARRTEGEVVEVRRNRQGSGAPDVAFTDHLGRAHLHRSDIYSRPPYRIGDRVTIAFDPDEPEDAAIDSPTNRWVVPAGFAGLGFILLCIVSFAVVRRARRKREVAWLRREGQRLDATVTAVTQDTTIRVNDRSPWVIRCEATLPGESSPRTFVSRRFWYNPGPHLRGPTVTVCYDPRAPSRHVVDTGDLAPGHAFQDTTS
jgi:hypothetical protein